MNKEQLINFIALGEGFTTEFKRAGTSNLGREICAFANATGGVILIGVANDGGRVGIADHNGLKSKVQSIARSADPPIAVEIESVDDILCVNVPAQQSKPYSFGGKFFIREGASSQQMSREEIREFFYKEGLIHFDETPCDKFSLDTDLGNENWFLFQRRAKIPPDMKPLTALRNLHLIAENDRMTHAGAWLLATDIKKFNISASVTCALFRGTDKTYILDRKEYTNDLYSIYESCMAYLQSKLNTALIPHAKGRDEHLELPEDALREALVNAIAHRDYRSTANVQIYIFNDRVEFVTPGGLPAGMHEKDLGVKSVPRNPLLFGIFHRMNLVEQIGSGIRRIRRMCQDYGIAEPEIEVSESWVTTTFKRSLEQDGNGAAPQVTPGVTPEVTPEVRKMLSIMTGEMTRGEIQKKLGLKDEKHFRESYQQVSVRLGLIEMTIPDKPTSSRQKYRLSAEGKAFLTELSGGEK